MAKTTQEKYETTYNHMQTLHGRLVKTKINARASAKKRGQECTLTDDDMLTMWNKQDGKCKYTGWSMTTQSHTDTLVSLERIDNTIGYVPNNCVLVCWCVNKARSGLSQSAFFDMCKSVAMHSCK